MKYWYTWKILKALSNEHLCSLGSIRKKFLKRKYFNIFPNVSSSYFLYDQKFLFLMCRRPCNKLYHKIWYQVHLACAGFKLKMLVVIDAMRSWLRWPQEAIKTFYKDYTKFYMVPLYLIIYNTKKKWKVTFQYR